MTEVTSRPPFRLGTGGAIAHGLGLVLAQSLLVFVLGIGFLGPVLFRVRNPFDGSTASFALVATVAVLDLVLVLWLGLFKVARLTPRDVGWRSPRPARDLSLGVLGTAACVAVLAAVVAAYGGSPRALLEALTDPGPRERFLYLCIGLLAAVSEETIFRGYLHNSLEQRWGKTAAVVLTAVLFALYHLQLRPAALLVKLGMGLVLGLLRVRTGSIWAPAVAHLLVWLVVGAT